MSAPEIVTPGEWSNRLRLIIEREGFAAEMIAGLALSDPDAKAALCRTGVGRAAVIELEAAMAARKKFLAEVKFP